MELERVDAARPGLLWPARIDPRGLTGPTRGQTAGPRWKRVSHGRYLPADQPITVEQRIVNAAAVLPWWGGLIGWAALRWYGGSWFEGTAEGGRVERPVTLLVSTEDIRPQPGIEIRAESLRHSESIRMVDGVRVTSPAWALLHEMRYAGSLTDAVVAYDMAAFDNLVTAQEAATATRWLVNMTGIPSARRAMHLVDENSWSPQETRLRLIWTLEAGLPRPECNLPVFDRQGRHLATPDLLDLEAGLAIEYDGAVHLERSRRRRDLLREDALRTHGLEYLTVTADDMRDRPALVRRLHAARARAKWEPDDQRRWSVVPPAHWTSLRTVAERRAHRSAHTG